MSLHRLLHRFFYILLLVFLLSLFGSIETVGAVERIEVQTKNGILSELIGQTIVVGTEGETVFQTRDGQIHLLCQHEIRNRWVDDTPFVSFTQTEMVDSLQKRFGSEFNIHTTEHYIIVYSTSDTYAQWCGTLFEKLYDKFQAVWKRRGLPIEEPLFPLVVIIFPNKPAFDKYGRENTHGDFPPGILACYHLLTNQVFLCDLTGAETNRESTGKKLTASQIREMMNRPGSGYNVSALLHEAAHQIGYNRGMFDRMAPVPRWVLEGIAILHEPPELDNVKKSLDDPKVNKLRLTQFQDFQAKQPLNAIQNLIRDDSFLLNPDTALDYYGLSWTLTYYLFKKRGKDFAQYLRMMEEKRIGIPDSAERRLEEFELFFGENWEKFYRDFIRFANALSK